MNECRAAILRNRAVLAVSGGDAAHFLQGLLTQNVEKLADGKAAFAALLTPQGKILFDFFVIRRGGEFLLDCVREASADLARRLGFYKLRAKVEIADRSAEFSVAAFWGGDDANPQGGSLVCVRDPRYTPLGMRLIGPARAIENEMERLGCELAGEAAYEAHRIALGVPEGGKDFAYGDIFPHDACMDELSGIDFSKGCFIGQEVVSRMRHRGTARKRFVCVEAEAPLPPPGTQITAGGSSIGVLTSSVGERGLALVRIDRAASAMTEGAPFIADACPVTLRKPDWATFDFPETVS